ncbi:MAG: peptidylprolyl isomerase [Anaerolineales bacterium]
MPPPFESRLIIQLRHNPAKTAALVFVWMLAFTACSPGSPQTTSYPQPSATIFTAAQLGPTSTPMPATPTQIPGPPTPTVRPLDPVTEQDWIRGPVDAELSFLEYCDFQSPPCADLYENLEALRAMHPDQIQLIYRQFPLLVLNDKAGLAAELALAADAQGAFWQMHDRLFSQQQIWSDFTEDQFIEWAVESADVIGLDRDQIASDLRQGKYTQAATDDFTRGISSGLPGTPFLLLNGEWFRTSPTLTNLEAAVRLELLEAMQYEQPPELEIDQGSLYYAHLMLNTGEVVIQLYPDSAPAAVANFIFLARRGWFDDTIFHRVVPGRYVEGGDPSATGLGGPGYFLPDEFDPALEFDRPGRVAMANAGPDTNGSRFAITLQPMPEWQDAKTIIGQVVEGLSLVSELESRDPLDDLLTIPLVKIIKVEIEGQ